MLWVFWTPNWIHRTKGKLVYAGRILRTAVASLALASFSVTAWAAGAGGINDLAALKSLSLEDLAAVQVDTVVGAFKHERKVTEAPSAVSGTYSNSAGVSQLYYQMEINQAAAEQAGLQISAKLLKLARRVNS
jgi:hypothetical protein